jgi:hypothetical protein
VVQKRDRRHSCGIALSLPVIGLAVGIYPRELSTVIRAPLIVQDRDDVHLTRNNHAGRSTSFLDFFTRLLRLRLSGERTLRSASSRFPSLDSCQNLITESTSPFAKDSDHSGPSRDPPADSDPSHMLLRSLLPRRRDQLSASYSIIRRSCPIMNGSPVQELNFPLSLRNTIGVRRLASMSISVRCPLNFESSIMIKALAAPIKSNF